ncbi:histidine kinase dimerization/phosphoacceptor domain -containing protein [Flavobacterium sp. F52]|uniref:tetratricopeptide repeat-containing sensor histidine kinase n=1 Tax=Flavobacterium sp. F52 TaxID=1202532 RepID=UPI000272D862|nr:histidine kinase dimerization/phosphoacceptor domain -containing protein [Flavobacterium sp. F52]EJG03169.1 signal transduction histidine kinase [Flavobacterium sp. F52]
MIKFLQFSALIFYSVLLFGQDREELSSLHRQSVRLAEKDTALVGSYLKIGLWHLDASGKKVFPKSKDSIVFYADKALKLSKKLHYGIGEGKSLLLYNDYYYQMYDPRSTVSAEQAMEIFKKLKYDKGIAESYLRLARDYENPDEKHIQTALKAKELYKKIKDPFKEGCSAKVIAEIYQGLGNFKNALLYAQESVRLFAAAKYQKEELVRSYLIIKLIYYYQGDIDKSFKYGLEALHLSEKIDSTSELTASCYSHVGTLYSFTNKKEQALEYLKKALEISYQYNNINFTAITTSNLVQILMNLKREKQAAEYLKKIENYNLDFESKVAFISKSILVYAELGRFSKADTYVRQALEILKRTEENVIVCRLYLPLAKYYFSVKQYSLSRLYYEKNKKWALKTNNKFILQTIYEQLFIIDSIQSDYKSAIQNLQFYQLYKDSILNEEASKRIEELTLQYQVVKKDKDLKAKENNNKLLVKQNKLQEEKLWRSNLIRNLSVLGVLVLGIFIALLYNRHKTNKRNNRLLQQQQDEIAENNEALSHLVTEKDWLLKEIHHRVKNNLHMIMSLLNSQSYFLQDKAAISAIQSSQHRIQSMSLIHQKLYMADNLSAIRMQEYISDLIEYLTDSFSGEKKVKFHLSVQEVEMDVSQAIPIGLIINEAVTNSFKYAFTDRDDGDVSVILKGGSGRDYSLEIKDNGSGLPQDFSIDNTKSLGMKLIKGLAKDLQGTLEIESDAQGTRIKIDFLHKDLQFGK